MGLFGKKHTVVDVVFRDLTASPADSPGGTYRYVWTLKQPPSIGCRARVIDIERKLAPVVVMHVDQVKDVRGLKPVARIVTQGEVDAAFKKLDDDLLAWFRMARKAAGLPVRGRVATKPPGDYPPIPPADGDASPKKADTYGRGWFRLWKRAEERGMPADEVEAYRRLAFRWFAVRDAG